MIAVCIGPGIPVKTSFKNVKANAIATPNIAPLLNNAAVSPLPGFVYPYPIPAKSARILNKYSRPYIATSMSQPL
jgi:hypothetical protein